MVYLACFSDALGAKQTTYDIKQISEEVFDRQDNLFVFFLDAAEDLLNRKEDIQRVVRTLHSRDELSRLRYYYNVHSEGDPPVPEGENAVPQDGAGSTPLRVVMYKGQRKTVLRIGDDLPVDRILEFYEPLSEEPSQAAKKLLVSRISGREFVQEILDASTPEKPVLLQLYEDTCFLCFLMRPFVNSLAVLFSERDVPLTIRRLNLEKNDFPDGCPVARGTPTFVMFRGPKAPPAKWEEFKPKELCERIMTEFPSLADDVFTKMDDLQGLVSRRFQLFTQSVMWTVELQKLEALHSQAITAAAGGGRDESADVANSKEDSMFNVIVSDMMSRDMRRTDGILDNLDHLQKEVDEAEHDAALLAAMLGQTVLTREDAEEKALRKAGRRRL